MSKKFDVVIGNPPYQEDIKGERNRADAIYPYFYDSAEEIADKYCLITPARFLFGVGSTPRKWNEKMLNDKHLKVVDFSYDSSIYFSGVDIMGGVAISYRDVNRDFGGIGTFVPHKELASILKKVEKLTDGYIPELLTNTNGYRYTPVLYDEFPKFLDMERGGGKNSVSSNTFTKFSDIFFDSPPVSEDSYIKVYGRKNNNRVFQYVKSDYIVKGPAFERYKVFVPGANGSGAIGEVDCTPIIGEMVVGNPYEAHTQTFMTVGSFHSKFEATSLLSYLKGKFSRAMLGIKKVTQNNRTGETWSKVPLQDFTEDSDIDWSKTIPEIDQQLYKKYNLNEEEIAFIEDNVKEMD